MFVRKGKKRAGKTPEEEEEGGGAQKHNSMNSGGTEEHFSLSALSFFAANEGVCIIERIRRGLEKKVFCPVRLFLFLFLLETQGREEGKHLTNASCLGGKEG